MQSQVNVFHTEVAHNKTIYDSWKFTRPSDFDSFWFSNKTTMLYSVADFRVGKDRFEVANIRVTPEVKIFKGKKVASSFGLFLLSMKMRKNSRSIMIQLRT